MSPLTYSFTTITTSDLYTSLRRVVVGEMRVVHLAAICNHMPLNYSRWTFNLVTVKCHYLQAPQQHGYVAEDASLANKWTEMDQALYKSNET